MQTTFARGLNNCDIETVNSYLYLWQIPHLEAPQVGRKQTGRFGYKYHTSWVSLEPQSAEDQRSFSGSKLLINSPYRICELLFVYGQLVSLVIVESAILLIISITITTIIF